MVRSVSRPIELNCLKFLFRVFTVYAVERDASARREVPSRETCAAAGRARALVQP